MALWNQVFGQAQGNQGSTEESTNTRTVSTQTESGLATGLAASCPLSSSSSSGPDSSSSSSSSDSSTKSDASTNSDIIMPVTRATIKRVGSPAPQQPTPSARGRRQAAAPYNRAATSRVSRAAPSSAARVAPRGPRRATPCPLDSSARRASPPETPQAAPRAKTGTGLLFGIIRGPRDAAREINALQAKVFVLEENFTKVCGMYQVLQEECARMKTNIISHRPASTG